jgi:hypothetical protein
MSRKMLVLWGLSLAAACLIVSAGISSAVHASVSDSGRKAGSPLFAHQINQSVQQTSVPLATSFLTKGHRLGITFARQPTLGETFKRAITMIQTNPRQIDAIFTAIEQNNQVLSYLSANGMTAQELHRYLNLIRTNPDQIASQLENLQDKIPASRLNNPAPLGLNTTNPFACVITVIVLLPVVLVIAFVVVLFTLRIFACMNLDAVLQQIMDQIVQGIHPAG